MQAIPQPANCGNACETLDIVNIPGVQGPAGADGTNGSNGINAFTITTAGFTMPAVGSDVTVAVATSAWMSVSQVVYVQGAGYFTVQSKPDGLSVVLRNLGYSANVAPTTVLAGLLLTSPAGLKGVDGTTPTVTLDDLSPTQAKGDLLVDNGANSPNSSLVRLAAPTDTYVWTADSTQPSGWLAKNPKLTATSALTFALVALNGGTDEQTIALPGAVVGDPVELGVPTTLDLGLIPFAYVSAADVVTVRLTNATGGNITPAAAQNYTVRINKL